VGEGVTDEVGGGASQTTDPAAGTSSATDISLREYFEALDRSNDKIDQWVFRFYEERDRRINEVNIEREKALKIKETADLAALGLAREIQTYKDEKANELRSQIERERGNYATRSDLVAMGDKFEAQLKPISEYVVGQQGGPRAITSAMLFSALFVGVAVIGVIVALANYFASH
jgi:vacuolar-type H+-ATPase subunit H